MSVSVNFYWVMLALIAVLAGLSLLSHFVVRRHVALIWLAAALVIGGAAFPFYVSGGSSPGTLATLLTLDTLAVFTVSQAVRIVVGQGRCSWSVSTLGAALWALSLFLVATQTGSVVVQALPFQIAGLLFIADSLAALARSRKRLPEWALIGGMGMYWASSLVRLPFYPSLMESGRAFPSLDAAWLNGFMLATSSVFVPLVVIAVIARDLGGHIETFREASMRDGLTGLLTRLAFEREVEKAVPKFGALIICDLDHFKSLNDTYGHPVGDEAIRAFARLCAAESPVAGRIGGEEFAILLPGQSVAVGEEAANRISSAYAATQLPGIDSARLTASFGIAAYGGRETFRETLVKADRALYRAKRQGRDCVVLHGTLSGEEANPILRIA